MILPDKDADGLSAGVILRRTLLLLGASPSLIHVHLIQKGTSINSEPERAAMLAYAPAYIFVIDQGSRAGPPLVDAKHIGLIIDHHHAGPDDFPQGAAHVTACESPPVATSALLTYELCAPLHPAVAAQCDWLCIVGTHGDLGNTLKWQPPFPDMAAAFKRYTKKTLNSVVSLVNAPRRTATYDVQSAWDALSAAGDASAAAAADGNGSDDGKSPAPAALTSILTHPRLLAARAEVNAEVERCTHTPPRFSRDGRVAVFRIHSAAQVHPVIATRWAGHLRSRLLEIVLVANDGYLPGKVNFSCRVARCAKGARPEGQGEVDIIASLREYARAPLPASTKVEIGGGGAAQAPATPTSSPGGHHSPRAAAAGAAADGADADRSLLDRLGQDFARGHVQASGGIVGVAEFEELMARMEVGVKPDRAEKESPTKKTPTKKKIDPKQSNTLGRYFAKAT